MKQSRAKTILICITSMLLLAGCGGGSFQAYIAGKVAGLSGGTTLILMLNGGNSINVTANGAFIFSSTISDGGTYNVTVGTQPVGETCTIANPSGTVNGVDVTTVTVTCVTNISNGGTVGGAISGLSSGTSVTLQNNGTDSFVASSNGAFVFPTAIANGATYNVTVLTQPSGKICPVSNGAGTMTSGTNVTSVGVSCS